MTKRTVTCVLSRQEKAQLKAKLQQLVDGTFHSLVATPLVPLSVPPTT